MPTLYSTDASEPQVRFIKSLWDDLNKVVIDPDDEGFSGTPEQAQALRDIEEYTLTELDRIVTKRYANGGEIKLSLLSIVQLVEGHSTISKSEASACIDPLKNLLASCRAKVAKVGLPKPPSPYAGVPENAERVIDARFASRCSVCGVRDQYIAYTVRGTWYPLCSSCAHVAPESQGGKTALEEAIQQVLVRLGKGDAQEGNIGLAVANADEIDGFSYYRVSRSGVAKIVGGSFFATSDDLRPAVALKVLEGVLKGDVVEMAKQFGRHFTRCGVCGRTLKDDASKALGIGPDCAKHL